LVSRSECVERNNKVSKQLRINIGLIVFITLLSILVIKSGEETEQELSRLSTIDQNDIVQIEILRKDLDDFIFNKQDGVWRMNSPQQYLANDARIHAMLRILNVKSHSQLNPAEVNLDAVGLTEPVIIMKLNEYEFKFGSTDAIDQRRYVLFNGEIHLTDDSLYNQLTTNAAFFANLNLLPEDYAISSIQYPENKIEKVGNQWQLATLMDISPDQLKRIVFNWKNAAAISANKYEPVKSDTESFIKILSENNEIIQFVIVSTEPHLILGRKDLGVQFHMGSDETRKLLLIEGVDLNEQTQPIGLELH
jgi:uncharacterized protein DUF4340